MRTYTVNPFSIGAANINDFQVLTLPLPDAEAFVTTSYNLAYPQILTFCGALIGITLVILLVKSFKG